MSIFAKVGSVAGKVANAVQSAVQPQRATQGTHATATPAPAAEQLTSLTADVEETAPDWLVNVLHLGAGLDVATATQLVLNAPAGVVAQISVCTAAEAVGTGDTLPEAHLGASANNRARPLDWTRAPAAGHLSPEAPEGQTAAQTHAATLQQTFDTHRGALFAETFGADLTLDHVRSGIAFAEAIERQDLAQGLRAQLFRISQYAVVETLNVEDSGRYQPGGGATYCNIYAHDVAHALGAYVPRVWWRPQTLQRIQEGARVMTAAQRDAARIAGEDVSDVVVATYDSTVGEMNANMLSDWMREHGAAFGWTGTTDMSAAQEAANGGKVVVLLAANQDRGRSGHITVVLAEHGDHAAARDADDEVRAPLQSQAGSSNFKHDNNDAGAGRDQWWENSSHEDGSAWIHDGSTDSPILTPEQFGL